MTAPKKRTSIYIDGFNLYRGAIEGTSHKWLNIQKFFEMLRPADDIVAINYFTAIMAGQQGVRQEIYLRALATLPKLRIVLGKYKTKRALCNVRHCTHSGDRMIVKWEEKRTDVNIAIRILDDAYQDVSDNIVLVSGDSDLVPALHAVKLRFPHKRLIVYVPARDPIRAEPPSKSAVPPIRTRLCRWHFSPKPNSRQRFSTATATRFASRQDGSELLEYPRDGTPSWNKPLRPSCSRY